MVSALNRSGGGNSILKGTRQEAAKITELKRKKIGTSTVKVGDFNPPLDVMGRTTWWKISKEIGHLNNSITN